MQYANSVLMSGADCDQRYIIFTIPIRIRLVTSLSSIRKTMRYLNEAKLCSYGSKLCYIMGPYGSRFYKMQISANEFTLQVFSAAKGENMVKDAMLKALSIMSYLSDECEPSIGSMYPYLMYVISEAKMPNEVIQIPHVQSRASELILARRINELRASERGARMECKAMEERAQKITDTDVDNSDTNWHFLKALDDKFASALAFGKRKGEYHK
jgi:hypothetical protein